jgi:hypothetical protein
LDESLLLTPPPRELVPEPRDAESVTSDVVLDLFDDSELLSIPELLSILDDEVPLVEPTLSMPLLVEEVELPSPVDEPDDVALFENSPDDERLDNDVVPTDCIVLDDLGFVSDNDRVLSEPPELNCALIVLPVTEEASFPLPLLPED